MDFDSRHTGFLDIQWTADLFLDADPLILDTETTGLGPGAEIIEVGIIDAHGLVMFESLVQPRSPIPSAATAIHGITNADVANAPTWAEVHAQVCGILEGRLVAAYSAAFDHRLLVQTAALYGLQIAAYRPFCVARAYARYHGEWDADKGTWKHQHLANAVIQTDVDAPDQGQAHRAVFDCHLALGVLQAMAGKKDEYKNLLNNVVII
jgi:DNA polymerase-3 subunit epsilon